MELKNSDELAHAVAAAASGNGEAIDRLTWTAVFADREELRDAARSAILEQAQSRGIYPASIHELYLARGRGECANDFTVPAINIRGASYDTARALFRARKALDAGAVICEIARSEITYTDQRPIEYTTVILAAALREGWTGPVFLQGDHFQVNAKKYATDAEAELKAVRDLTAEGIEAGFYNIDVDTSTLVDLSKETQEEQQELNGRLCAELTQFIREHQPQGVDVSVGGEIGEVGGKNSTPEELRAFMAVYKKALDQIAPGAAGISKISIQTGTSHGGVPLPDGSIAEVSIDFDALKTCSQIAREEYGMAGAVQHGASTLPAELFDRFPKDGACEIHLATEFQNMIYDNPSFPAELTKTIHAKLEKDNAGERKDTDTDEQFIYKTRKKALGPFKRELWSLPDDVKTTIARALEDKFIYLLTCLNVKGTRGLCEKWAPFVEGSYPVVRAGMATARGPEDVTGLSD